MNLHNILEYMAKVAKKATKVSKKVPCGKCYGTGLLSAHLHCDACNAHGVI